MVIAVALVVSIAPVVLVALAGSEPAMLTPNQHFGLVGGAAALTSLASLLLSVAGARARDGRSILMGTAFSTMTALFAVHALSTPGFLVGENGMISLAGGLSVPAGVLILALTAHPALRRPAHLGGLVALQVGLFVGIIVLGGVGLAFSEAIPAEGSPVAQYTLKESVALAFVAALQVLTPSQRAVLLLRDVVGLSAAETAEASSN